MVDKTCWKMFHNVLCQLNKTKINKVSLKSNWLFLSAKADIKTQTNQQT